MTLSLSDRIRDRARRLDLSPADPLIDALATYLAELARWNRTINLTACRLDPHPDEAAIDRLILEPLVAARHVPSGAASLVDIGSGGGSPAIPLALAVPGLRLLMVEMRARKAAFLRHALRTLAIANATVAVTRAEALDDGGAGPRFALASMRAVRFDATIARAIDGLLEPAGTVLWFVSPSSPERPISHDLPVPWRIAEAHQLLAASGATLLLLSRG